jgi:hypothetical protein
MQTSRLFARISNQIRQSLRVPVAAVGLILMLTGCTSAPLTPAEQRIKEKEKGSPADWSPNGRANLAFAVRITSNEDAIKGCRFMGDIDLTSSKKTAGGLVGIAQSPSSEEYEAQIRDQAVDIGANVVYKLEGYHCDEPLVPKQ